MAQRLPIVPSIPNYRFGTDLDGTQYRFAFHWNERAGLWYMDVLEVDDTPIRMGIAVVLGVRLGHRTADSRFPPGELKARDLSGQGREAGLDDFGERVVLDYQTPDEVAAFEALAEAA